MKFVTAQPDVKYFHWQCEIYCNNFVNLGINPNDIVIIFGSQSGIESTFSKRFKERGFNVHYYQDLRRKTHYIPSIKPYLISKWVADNKEDAKNIFLHDADIIFRELPDFNTLLNDDLNYLSDTVSYIGYNYIMDCNKRYVDKYNLSHLDSLIQTMCTSVNIEEEIVKNNQINSGGGQYILKNTDWEFWYQSYIDSTILYDAMINYHNKYKIDTGNIQFWTAEMWSILWNLWKRGFKTKVTDELSFCWATCPLSNYYKTKILHIAGVTHLLKDKLFFKGEFTSINPIKSLLLDATRFDYIDKDSTTNIYIEEMRKIVGNYK